MLTIFSRTLGALLMLALAAIGLGTVAGRIFSWKEAHDDYYDDRRGRPPAVI